MDVGVPEVVVGDLSGIGDRLVGEIEAAGQTVVQAGFDDMANRVQPHALHALRFANAANGVVAIDARHVEDDAAAALQQQPRHALHFAVALRIVRKVAEIALVLEQAVPVLAMHMPQAQLRHHFRRLDAQLCLQSGREQHARLAHIRRLVGAVQRDLEANAVAGRTVIRICLHIQHQRHAQ